MRSVYESKYALIIWQSKVTKEAVRLDGDMVHTLAWAVDDRGSVILTGRQNI